MHRTRSPSPLWLLLGGISACHASSDAEAKLTDSPEAGACQHSADAAASSHDVLTQHNDVGRTGATLSETVLDTCNVQNVVQLGTYAVDDEVYAQPLYASGISTQQGTKNLLLVATMADSLFAFDADQPGSAPLWQQGQQHELGTPALSSRNVGGNNGILATPVIDPSVGTVFVVSRDCDQTAPPAFPSCIQRLFAIELATGKVLSSAEVAGVAPAPAGVSGTRFDPNLHWSRAALLLQHDQLFVSFGSGPNGDAHEEDFSFHGWLFGYQARDLSQPPSVYCSTPDFGGGAIWQSGNGPAADEDAVYFATGNGIHQPTPVAPAGFPEQPEGDEDSVVRVPLSAPVSGLHYWDDRPYHADGNVFQYMEKNDIDLGTAGPLLIPGSTQLIAGGKSGILYTLERATLQPTQAPIEAFSSPALASGQSKYIYSYSGGPHLHGSPAFARLDDADGNPGPGLIFYWPALERLTSFSYDYASGLVTQLADAAVPKVDSGGTLAISADGGRPDSAIVWASAVDADSGGHLWALSATRLTRLWDAKLPAWEHFQHFGHAVGNRGLRLAAALSVRAALSHATSDPCMAAHSGSRAPLTFGVLNGVAGVVLLVGVFVLAQPRFWGLDVPALLIGAVQLTSAVALLARLRWALRALTVAAWVSFVLGLLIVFLIVITMVFLRGIHGDYGVAGLAVSGLVVALLVPYVVVLPALELLWLGKQRAEPKP